MRTVRRAALPWAISLAVLSLIGCSGSQANSQFAPPNGVASSTGAAKRSPIKLSTQYSQSVVYAFQGGVDGSLSYAGLIGLKGALYGTTLHGGGGSTGFGTVYKVVPSASGGSETQLYAFAGGTDGQYPYAGLVADKHGNLYGTTYQGGTDGPGTVFELSPSGSGYAKTTLYSFKGGSDGANPFASLVIDKNGALYGTTIAGGGTSGSYGTVFKLTPATSGYTEEVLHAFQGGTNDGANPYASLLLYKGALYGTTFNGGRYNTGTVFEISGSGSSYTERVLYTFQASSDASHPYGGVIADNSGALYGASSEGGSTNGGTVFKLTRSGSTYTESLLYTFTGCGFSLDGDGCDPQAGLYIGLKCDLFGTTLYGGTAGQGAVFELVPNQLPRASGKCSKAGGGYTDNVLYSFQGGSDGKNPEAGLTSFRKTFYSTAFYGGAYGDGVVFKLQKVKP